jgi:hypothetical protein
MGSVVIDGAAGGGSVSADSPGDWNAEDGVTTQLDSAETLVNRGVVDPLDEGYSPPDRAPRVRVPTQEEEARGERLDDYLAAELPDVGSDDPDGPVGEEDAEGDRIWPEDHERGDDRIAGPGAKRSGRLVHNDDNGFDRITDDMTAGDVGIDGGAASAEEAAMHVFDPGDDDQDDLED